MLKCKAVQRRKRRGCIEHGTSYDLAQGHRGAVIGPRLGPDCGSLLTRPSLARADAGVVAGSAGRTVDHPRTRLAEDDRRGLQLARFTEGDAPAAPKLHCYRGSGPGPAPGRAAQRRCAMPEASPNARERVCRLPRETAENGRPQLGVQFEPGVVEPNQHAPSAVEHRLPMQRGDDEHGGIRHRHQQAGRARALAGGAVSEKRPVPPGASRWVSSTSDGRTFGSASPSRSCGKR